MSSLDSSQSSMLKEKTNTEELSEKTMSEMEEKLLKEDERKALEAVCTARGRYNALLPKSCSQCQLPKKKKKARKMLARWRRAKEQQLEDPLWADPLVLAAARERASAELRVATEVLRAAKERLRPSQGVAVDVGATEVEAAATATTAATAVGEAAAVDCSSPGHQMAAVVEAAAVVEEAGTVKAAMARKAEAAEGAAAMACTVEAAMACTAEAAMARTAEAAEGAAEKRQLQVTTLAGYTRMIFVHKAATVADVKKAIFTTEGVPPEEQRLIFKGRQLKDDCAIKSDGTYTVVLRLRGGATPRGAASGSRPSSQSAPATPPARCSATAAHAGCSDERCGPQGGVIRGLQRNSNTSGLPPPPPPPPPCAVTAAAASGQAASADEVSEEEGEEREVSDDEHEEEDAEMEHQIPRTAREDAGWMRAVSGVTSLHPMTLISPRGSAWNAVGCVLLVSPSLKSTRSLPAWRARAHWSGVVGRRRQATRRSRVDGDRRQPRGHEVRGAARAL
jgi:large subunit ribosomal protein L40e